MNVQYFETIKQSFLTYNFDSIKTYEKLIPHCNYFAEKKCSEKIKGSVVFQQTCTHTD